MKLLNFFIVLIPLILSNSAYADPSNDNNSLESSSTLPNNIDKNGNLETSPNNSTFLEMIYGKTPKNGVVIQPYGIHTKKLNEGLTENYLVGVVYNSIAAGTFINSFHNRTIYLGVTRNLYSSNGFGIDYFLGALYGYHGKLSTVSGVPFRDSFLCKYNINPAVSIDAYYEISEAVRLELTITPLVILGGIKYNL